MIIRKARTDDLAEILSLQKKAFMEVARGMDQYDLAPLRQTLDDLIQEYDTWDLFLKCVTDENQIIGSVRARMDAHHSCHIGKLIVDPDYQKKGIGSQLMTTLETYFPEAVKFALFTSADTPHTARLYQKMGYQIVGTQKMDDILMILMEKPGK